MIDTLIWKFNKLLKTNKYFYERKPASYYNHILSKYRKGDR
jgi:hypothetical protein